MKTILVALLCAPVLCLAVPSAAQVKPMHSGHMSHGAAQMRADGSGLHHPNRPAYHHHEGYAGYRPVHKGGAVYREADAATGTLIE